MKIFASSCNEKGHQENFEEEKKVGNEETRDENEKDEFNSWSENKFCNTMNIIQSCNSGENKENLTTCPSLYKTDSSFNNLVHPSISNTLPFYNLPTISNTSNSILPFNHHGTKLPAHKKSLKEKWSSIDLTSSSPLGSNHSSILNDVESNSLSSMNDDLYYRYIRLSLLLITFLAAIGIVFITLGFLFFNHYNNSDNSPWMRNIEEDEHRVHFDFIDSNFDETGFSTEGIQY